MRQHELRHSKVVWALTFALSSLFLAGSAAAAVSGAQMRFLAGFAEAKSPPSLMVRHRFRHHRRRRLKSSAPAPDSKSHAPSADTELEGQSIQKPAPGAAKPSPKEAVKPLAKEEPANAPESMGPPPPPEKWTAAEVDTARTDCVRRIWGLNILFQPLDPIKEGACGSPAPVRLLGFDYGREPALLFSPQPTVSCKLAENLRRWTDSVLQPSARAHLHSRIVSITTLSSYHCRSRYDDPGQRISQHALANAVDISEFITEKGEHISVLDNWISTGERSAFLHAIHDGACEIFGTTLGPEANDAHRNHFHLDMKERLHPLCDFTPEQMRAREEAKKKAPAPAVPVIGGDRPSAAGSEAKPIPGQGAR